MCVSEEGGREGGGGGRGADTEVKTKTPHVNVGNKTYHGFIQRVLSTFLSHFQPTYHDLPGNLSVCYGKLPVKKNGSMIYIDLPIKDDGFP